MNSSTSTLYTVSFTIYTDTGYDWKLLLIKIEVVHESCLFKILSSMSQPHPRHWSYWAVSWTFLFQTPWHQLWCSLGSNQVTKNDCKQRIQNKESKCQICKSNILSPWSIIIVPKCTARIRYYWVTTMTTPKRNPTAKEVDNRLIGQVPRTPYHFLDPFNLSTKCISVD